MPQKKGKRAREVDEVADEGSQAKVKKNGETVTKTDEKASEGLVLSVGMGDMGQLGLGEDIAERNRPAIITKLQEENVISIQSGGMHTVALTTNGEAYSWGCNDEGALGRATEGTEDEAIPALIQFPGKIILISAGDNHTAFLHENGSVFCCGAFRDPKGMIGLTANGKSHRTPIQVWASNPQEKCTSISSGNEHVAFLTNKGCLYTFGVGEQGQLGRIPSCFADRGGRRGLKALLNPQQVRVKWGLVESVFCGGYQTFAICSSQVAYAWGLNNYGQLGVGDTEVSFVPRKVQLPQQFVSFSAAQHHSLALAQNGKVYACGRGEYGRLGLGDEAKCSNVFIEIPSLEDVRDIACAGCVSFAVTGNGKAHAWGMGTNLQLAAGIDDEDVLEPRQMKGKNIDARQIRRVSPGGQHVVILAEK